MSDRVIEVKGVSKQYRLGMVGTGTLSHDLNRWWARVRGKEDPYSRVGQVNKRDQKAESDYVWALKDINFDVRRGEILGIIGANGAGKSTLLKLMSRITAPTTGHIRSKGRIASLLEVGTGMHPEMTARENIYLNGSIMGMRRHEITRKFDDIIDFAGCQMYVDTPVKRFSSGMSVRLGFAVAAFLEPEILIVDEVLAVGDAEFQRKCQGKMKEVSSKDGRTILFVSHNMLAIKTLCSRCVQLTYGRLIADGPPTEIVQQFLNDTTERVLHRTWRLSEADLGNDIVRLVSARIIPTEPAPTQLTIDSSFSVAVEYVVMAPQEVLNISLHMLTCEGVCVFNSYSTPATLHRGTYTTLCKLPGGLLNADEYSFDIHVVQGGSRSILSVPNALRIEISEEARRVPWLGKQQGVVRPTLDWSTTCLPSPDIVV